MKPKAILFDMDGVIVDNAQFHRKAWQSFCEQYKIAFDEKEFEINIFRKNNRETLNHYFNKELNENELVRYANQNAGMKVI